MLHVLKPVLAATMKNRPGESSSEAESESIVKKKGVSEMLLPEYVYNF